MGILFLSLTLDFPMHKNSYVAKYAIKDNITMTVSNKNMFLKTSFIDLFH